MEDMPLDLYIRRKLDGEICPRKYALECIETRAASYSNSSSILDIEILRIATAGYMTKCNPFPYESLERGPHWPQNTRKNVSRKA